MVYSQAGGMACEFDAIGLARAADVRNDSHPARGGVNPCFENAFALGNGH